VACLLELAPDEEILTARAECFDHYQVVTHSDGTPVELVGAMGIILKAFDTILGNKVALKVIAAHWHRIVQSSLWPPSSRRCSSIQQPFQRRLFGSNCWHAMP
jgi:hypothetical protein